MVESGDISNPLGLSKTSVNDEFLVLGKERAIKFVPVNWTLEGMCLWRKAWGTEVNAREK